MTELRRVPSGTTEITYTGPGGVQRSIAVHELEPGYAYAEPADSGDLAALDAMGHDRVALKAMGQEGDDQPDPEPTTKPRTRRREE